MNTVINNILSNDDELFNRVRAYGPGDGINRLMVTVEDTYSISDYGLRETTQSFPAAVDIADLTSQAMDYLNSVKDPRQDVSVTYYFGVDSGLSFEDIVFDDEVVDFGGESIVYYLIDKVNDVKRGDTVRVASRDLDTTFTGVVQEIDWQPGQVTFLLGQPAYDILEVINRVERSDRRTSAALGLPTPLGFTGFPSNPGITVRVNPYTNSRAVGIEVYADTSPLTTVSKDKLVAKGSETTFHFPDFETNQTFYFRARSYDNQGNVSELTDEIQVTSGFLTGALRIDKINSYEYSGNTWFITNLATSAFTTDGYWPAGSAGDTIEANRIFLNPTIVTETLQPNETLYVINFPVSITSGSDGVISLSDFTLFPNFNVYSGGGNKSYAESVNVVIHANYSDTVPANTYELSIKIVQLVFRSYS